MMRTRVTHVTVVSAKTVLVLVVAFPEPAANQEVSVMRPRLTLAGQLLALQLGIVCVVLVGVATVSLAQSYARFGETEGARARSVAETVAATGPLREVLEERLAAARGSPKKPSAGLMTLIRSIAENNRSVSGASSVIVTGTDGVVLAPADPDQPSTKLALPGSPLVTGRGWLGEVDLGGRRSVVAQVPVFSDGDKRPLVQLDDVIGVVVVAKERPLLLDNLELAVPNLLTYLGIASGLGVLGSLLLARRVKRQTLGLEPREITGLAEHREALLHGVKEGVIATDQQNRVTLLNDSAAALLRLAPDAVGRTLGELDMEPALEDVLTGREEGPDLAVPAGHRVLILNRMPVSSRGRPLGSVTTLRDRTELISLQRELDAVQQMTDTLRAQAHEFSNRLHTISGLIELGEYDEVTRYVQHVKASDAQLTDAVTSRVADPAVAALLVAKGNLAAEQGIELRITPTTRMKRATESLSSDVATVLGNLVDNALDALAPGPGWVEVEVRHDGGDVVVTVRDSGPGVSPEVAADVFRRGFSTKVAAFDGQRGIGLALVRLLCVRRGGDVRLANDGGAVFIARLPAVAEAPT
jgi:sensor histidine kinase regulating citrate/malate metabolism